MTVLPPGLIDPPEHHGTVVAVERSHGIERGRPEPRWSGRSVAFVLLLVSTIVVLAITVADVANG